MSMRVAVTGASGRLGRALVKALEDAPFTGMMGPTAWGRLQIDLDFLTADSVASLIDRDRPEVIIHAAAWTDVDACARDPKLARRRNGTATGLIAEACASRGTSLAIISTNEVFDGRRTDGAGYRPDDPVGPINPYGRSKLEGEQRAMDAIASGGRAALAIVRTAWLHGPPGHDFPARIAAAAQRASAAGEVLRVVGDEIGCPTYAPDVAEAITELIAEDELCRMNEPPRTHHLVNGGQASRAEWARAVVEAVGIDVELAEVPASTWERASTPPLWAVLDPTPLPSGQPMRPWAEAFADAVPALRRALGTG